jgi:hypothetical protein
MPTQDRHASTTGTSAREGLVAVHDTILPNTAASILTNTCRHYDLIRYARHLGKVRDVALSGNRDVRG